MDGKGVEIGYKEKTVTDTNLGFLVYYVFFVVVGGGV